MADAFSVSVATPADKDPVSAVLEASYPALMRDSYDPALLAAALPAMTKANPALLSSGTYYVARNADGLAVGCGGWTAERPGGGETEPGLAHIRHFATHPDWAGRGIGRLLYARCETDARAAGACRFECCSSLNAEEFYAALGFKTVRRMKIPMSNGVRVPNVVMQRWI